MDTIINYEGVSSSDSSEYIVQMDWDIDMHSSTFFGEIPYKYGDNFAVMIVSIQCPSKSTSNKWFWSILLNVWSDVIISGYTKTWAKSRQDLAQALERTINFLETDNLIGLTDWAERMR